MRELIRSRLKDPDRQPDPKRLQIRSPTKRVHLDQAYGNDVSLDVYRLPPHHVADLVILAGLTEVARLVREAGENENTPQAFFLFRKGGTPS
jgi:hypothetical protein